MIPSPPFSRTCHQFAGPHVERFAPKGQGLMYCQSIGIQKRYHMMESRPMVPSLMNCNCNLSRNNSIDTVPLKFSRPRPEALRILETCHMQNHRKSPLYRRPSHERVGKHKKNTWNAHGILGLCNKVHNTVDISSPRISPKVRVSISLV